MKRKELENMISPIDEELSEAQWRALEKEEEEFKLPKKCKTYPT